MEVDINPRFAKCIEGANRELSELLYKIDESEDSQERSILFRRIHNLVEELHWKTISFLSEAMTPYSFQTFESLVW